MEKFKDKLIRFMYGRYGVDQLYYAAVYRLFCSDGNQYVPALAAVLAVDAGRPCLDDFSDVFAQPRGAAARKTAAFLRVWNPVKAFFLLTWNRIREFRTHVYAKCPHCKAVLRLPRRKGEHTVRCPRCQESFPIKVHFGEKKP